MSHARRATTSRSGAMRLQQPGRAQPWSSRAGRLAGFVVLLTAIAATYGGAIDAPFIYDDGASVVHNSSIVRLWPLVSRAGNGGPLAAPAETPLRSRPVANLSLAINYHFSQLAPRGYHLTNVALHMLAAVLLWEVVRRTLEMDFFHERFAGVSEPLAFASALVWALHPLATESVEYVTQRTEVLMALCYLATLLACQRYWAATGRGGRAAWLAAAVVACQLGMLSKETMATAPAVVLLYERMFVAGSFRRALRDSWPLYYGLALTWLPLLALLTFGARTPMAGFGYGVIVYYWWFTQAKALLLYLKLVVWPAPLSIHYEWPLIDSVRQAWPWLLAASVLIAGVFYAVVRRSAIGFVFAAMLAVLSPTLIIPVTTEVVAERRMYLPLAAVAPLVIAGAYLLVQRGSERAASRGGSPNRQAPLYVTVGGAIVLAGLYCFASAARASLYNDPVALWQDAERHQPDSFVIQSSLGVALDSVGRKEEAITCFQRAVELDPEHFLAHLNLAGSWETSGRLADAQREYEEVLRLRPDMGAAHYNVARFLERNGDLAKARAEYEEALRRFENFPRAHFALGALLEKMNEPRQAQQHYEEALRLAPDYPAAHRNLAVLLDRAGQSAAALGHFEEACRLAPSVESYASLAVAYARANRSAEALAVAQRGARMAQVQGNRDEAARLQNWASAYRQSLAAPAK